MNRFFRIRLLAPFTVILRPFHIVGQLFQRDPFDFVEDEDLEPAELTQAQRVLGRHRRRVSVFFRNSQIILQVAIGLKAGMYAVFVQQTFGLQGAAQLQTISLTAYFTLNIIMGVLADSVIGRRKVYLGGVILFACSYAFYGLGTWQSCQLAEVCFGSALACVSGVLGVWFRNIIENTFYLRSRITREDIDDSMIAIETNDFCRKSNKQVFGFRAVFMTVAGIIGGFTATYSSPTHVWFLAGIICILLSIYVWWHMFHNTIPVQARTVKRIHEHSFGRMKWLRDNRFTAQTSTMASTIYGAGKTMFQNTTVLAFIIIGSMFGMIFQIVRITWVPILEPAMTAHGIGMWVATVLTILCGVSGGVIVILFERTEKYKKKQEAEQTRYDYLILRNCMLLLGILLISTRMFDDTHSVAITLMMFLVGGIFARVHAGSITSNTPAKARREFGSTMLSIYETAVAAMAILSSAVTAILIKEFHWELDDILGSVGIVALVLALVLRFKIESEQMYPKIQK